VEAPPTGKITWERVDLSKEEVKIH
jgi:hypothetical protein